MMFLLPYLFPFSIGAFTVGAVGSLLFGTNDRGASRWAHCCAFVGALASFLFGLSVVLGNSMFEWHHAIGISGLYFSMRIDALSGFFLTAISVMAALCSVYGVGYMKHFYKKYSISTFGFFYNIFIVSLLLVVSASNVLFFLVAWEAMSVASYFLVIFENKEEMNMHAGYVYFIMTHIGTACIMMAFFLLYSTLGSFDFALLRERAVALTPFLKSSMFLLFVIGFGTKAGIIPFHVWLPKAHPAAPSHVSALMSSVMIKTGIYMMIRLFLGTFSSIPLWWGLVVVLLGAISCLLGVLYALTEHDIKRLLAYHSIENIGIILLGLGAGMVFIATGNMAIAALGLAAALYHIMNHALFKGLLFLGAGSVISATHTRNIEEYGGLLKLMPVTGLFFLIGAIAISALPPLNGFASEWLTYQALFGGLATMGFASKAVFIVAIASLAFAGGLAAACFVKAFGATFLARPRSHESEHAHENTVWMTAPMGVLAFACLAFGLGARWVVPVLTRIADSVLGNTSGAPAVALPLQLPMVFLGLMIAMAVCWLAVAIVSRGRKVVMGRTWGCGFPTANSRMEITATGFSRTLVMIFRSLLRPVRSIDVVSDPRFRYAPTSVSVHCSVGDVYQDYLYRPLHTLFAAIAHRVKLIQHGNVNVYVLYIGVTLIALLVWVTR